MPISFQKTIKKIKKARTVATVVVVVLFIITTMGASCTKEDRNTEPVELTMWNLWDDSDTFETLIAEYRSYPENKHVTINYSKKTIDSYEKDLLQGLATPNGGPDIYAIKNEWLPDYLNKITAMPAAVGTASEIREAMVDVVAKDMIVQEQVVGAAPYIDTLALVYNKDLLNTAGIAQPPATWTEFSSVVSKLTSIDKETGTILQAGTALGTVDNVNSATDIYSMLALQSGTKIIDEDQGVVFHKTTSAEGAMPGLGALQYYTSFATGTSENYTWNTREDDALQAFTQGKVAMLITYAHNLPLIQAKAPKLNIGTAKVPQISTTTPEISYTTYWPLVVANTTPEKQEEAWRFLHFMMTKSEQYPTYLKDGNHPTARRIDVPTQSQDPLLGPFAKQSLTARSRYVPNQQKVDLLLRAMIQSVIYSAMPLQEALEQTGDQVEVIYAEFYKAYQKELQAQKEAQEALETQK